MVKVLETTTQVWEKFAKFILSISFRYLCLFAAFLFCLFPGNLSFLTGFDRVMLAAISRAAGLQVGPAQISLVSVPDEIADSWNKDFYDTDQLSSLISNILHSSTATVGLLLDRPLASHDNAVDEYFRSTAATDDTLMMLLNKKQYLNELLLDPRVVLGAMSNSFAGASMLQLTDTVHPDIKTVAIKRWYQNCLACQPIAGANSHFDDSWRAVVSGDQHVDQIWLETKDGVSSSFLSALVLNKQTRTSAGSLDTLVQQPSVFSSNISVGESLGVPLAPFVAAHKTMSSFEPKVISLTLNEALLVNAFPEFVLVVSESNKQMAYDKAAILYSLINQRTFSTPWWFEPLSRLALFLFIIYLLFLHFRFQSAKKRVGILAALVTGVIALDVFFAFYFKLWYPISSLLSYGLSSFALVSLWYYHKQQNRRAEKDLVGVIDRVAYRLEERKEYTDAMSLWVHSPDRKSAIEKICRITNKMQQENTPVQQMITLVGSLLPLVDNDRTLSKKLVSLKKQQAELGDFATTQARNQADLNQIPETLGRYQIQKEIGRGAVGVVYLGFDPAISRSVAIKTLDAKQFSRDQHESLQARFFREAEAAGRLNHPNIVSVFDVGEDGDLAYIAMDYVEGVALTDYVSKAQLLPVADVFRIAHDVAMALSYAHENQIVHRDIKPGNIMYCAEPYTVKVADFGIARLLDNSKTSTGEILGSPLYMAPEQLKGSKVGPTADIFSLGVTFYQLLSGELPFNADNLASLTYEIIHTRHKNIRSVRKELPASAARIVNQCLQKKIDDRYETALELAGVIRKAIRRDFPSEAKRWGMV